MESLFSNKGFKAINVWVLDINMNYVFLVINDL